MKTIVVDKMPKLFWQIVKEKKLDDITPNIENPKSVEAVIMRTKTVMDSNYMDRFPNLKLIIRAGSGYDNIDCLEAKKRGIFVCNTPQANVNSAYEHTLAMIFSLIKQLQVSKKNILNAAWKEKLKFNWEISDLKVLVVGVGRIGSKVAKILKELGAEVKGVDPYLSEMEKKDRGIEFLSYEEGLKWCNLITFHCQLYSETYHYFSFHEIDILRRSVWLINAARGSIINMEAVKKGINNGKILGAAFDVFEKEPPDITKEWNKPNIFLTPHFGAATKKAKNRMAKEALEIWTKFQKNPQKVKQIDFRFVNFQKKI